MSFESTRRTNLARLLSPRTIAVVGANEKLGMSNNAVIPMLEAGHQVVLVNPSRDMLYGQAALPSLSAFGEPVDAVLSLVNAERSLDVLEEAAALGCGGVVISAAGFVELGETGAALQNRLQEITERTGVAVVGPNCAGFKNVPLGVNLFTGGRLDLAAGRVSIVSQSGFLVRSAMAAAQQRQLGVSTAVSSGNEAACDLADYVHVLAADEHTTVICLVIETIRRPEAFFLAVAEARALGKPVLALKLGRSDRARNIMQSHTGAIADASWVYDLAFREHGIVGAHDIDDLLDKAQLLAQIPHGQRTRINSIGLITTSGGVAALAADIADDENAPLPPLVELTEWVRERVPGDTVNPLDLTGFVMSKAELMEEVFEKYANSVDLLALGWWTGDADEGWSTTLLHPFANVSARSTSPFVVTPVESTSVGPWVNEWRGRDLHFARGIQSLYRSVAGLNAFLDGPLRERNSTLAGARTTSTDETRTGAIQPNVPNFVDSEAGQIVGFADAMAFLSEVGIDVAPFVVIDSDQSIPLEVANLGDRLVVKLADVPHRTELGAVRLNVTQAELEATIEELRAIARTSGVPETVAVQSMVAGSGESFIGLQGENDLGAVLLFGRGGVLLEVAGGVGGRFLPIDEQTASALANEIAGADAFKALRGQKQWPIDAIVKSLLALNQLWLAHGSWIGSVDINPLIVTDTGLIAVDAVFVARKNLSL
jgi:acetate---CoA ligase (ADP-forming)